ncbi:MAG: type II toxin-antitoxin system death-on-curing family toxin [Gemmatimonadetes bacterium]|nr:type II toxin-antitoxin system death-on-curing family toxin [Gemmatimonadota bacterium]
MTEEPRWITEAVLLAMHAQQIERYGGKHGIRDKNVVLSALARPINRWAYDDDSDFADLAAAYLVGFAGSQGFSDGNKRTGLAAALLFLVLNGLPVVFPAEELYRLTMAVSRGETDHALVATYLRKML